MQFGYHWVWILVSIHRALKFSSGQVTTVCASYPAKWCPQSRSKMDAPLVKMMIQNGDITTESIIIDDITTEILIESGD